MEFLVFRLPEERSFRMIKNEKSETPIASFFSFEKGEACRFFSDEIQEINENELANILAEVKFPQKKAGLNSPQKKEYLEKISQTIEVIRENNLQKMVLSRPLKLSFDKIDLAQTFLNLCQKYPKAFCYIGNIGGQIWMGATPEILGQFDVEKSVFQTMSLAGTLPIGEEWTEKESEEQSVVTQYLSQVLTQFSESVKISPREDLNLGKIKHLKNNIKAVIAPRDLDFLVKELHPTPAVCGIPKDFCQQKISEIEGYHRGFYSGYIEIKIFDKIYFFVNIRCVQFFENEGVIYVGGGVTEKSIPEREWEETELKSQTILDNLKGDGVRLSF